MTTISPKSITIDGNVRCKEISPKKDYEESLDQLTTVGFVLTKDQAIHLARVLLAASQDWDTIYVTGFRLTRRQRDGTFEITVTTKNR